MSDKQKYFKSSIHYEKLKFNTKSSIRLTLSDLSKQCKSQSIDENTLTITEYGLNLSEWESRVLEGIQVLLDRTNYRGNVEPKVIVNSTTFNKVPRLKFKAKDLLEVLDIKKVKKGAYQDYLTSDRQDVFNTLRELSTKKFFFKYYRKNNNIDEPVSRIDSLLTLEEVKFENNDRTKEYIVTPSPVIIDQISLSDFNPNNSGSYYILKPVGWRKEIKELVNHKSSKYIFRFFDLLFLRHRELYRHNNKKDKHYKGLILNYGIDTLASTLRVPESTTKTNSQQTIETLVYCFDIAVKAGYITYMINNSSEEKLAITDTIRITLNKDKFHMK